ncbi:hypothetical protein D3C75_129590 [compost metagenome]|jgi:hypothetical protein|uniref:hypothetical protein n=1 Tax=Stenotrophomonas sp. PA-6-5C TaxID=2665487 RepID=UPI000F9A36E4|nr:hypothetical protein [Stenotrophomonas sp. PA-6-5C]MCF5088820.1 hypothetical protein [Stenotrophomonas sp. PA-6-5C]
MKTAWGVLASVSLLCAALSAWLLFTSSAGPRMYAAMQLLIAGLLASVICTILSVALADYRRRLLSAALLAGYAVAVLVYFGSMGNVS